MGLHPDYKHLLKTHFPSTVLWQIPKAPPKSKNKPEVPEDPKIFIPIVPSCGNNGRVIIDDRLTKLKLSSKTAPKITMAGLFNMIVGDVFERFNTNSDLLKYVLCLDDDKNKQQKAEETASRDEKVDENDMPYSDGWSVRDSGFVDENGLMVNEVSVTRFFNTRYLRCLMFHWCAVKLQNLTVAKGKTFIYDYKQSEPLVGNFDGWSYHPEWYHNHGEADLSMIYWLDKYKSEPVQFVIETIDSDIIALAIPALWNMKDSKFYTGGVIWQTRWEVMDLKLLIEMMKEDFSIDNPEVMVLILILCNTDFYKNKELTKNIGFEYIVETIMGLKNHAEAIMSEQENPREVKVLKILECFIPLIYEAKLFAKRPERKGGRAIFQYHELEYEELMVLFRCIGNEEMMKRIGIYNENNRINQTRLIDAYNNNPKNAGKEKKVFDETKWFLYYPSPEEIKASCKKITFNLKYWVEDPYWKELDLTCSPLRNPIPIDSNDKLVTPTPKTTLKRRIELLEETWKESANSIESFPTDLVEENTNKKQKSK